MTDAATKRNMAARPGHSSSSGTPDDGAWSRGSTTRCPRGANNNIRGAKRALQGGRSLGPCFREMHACGCGASGGNGSWLAADKWCLPPTGRKVAGAQRLPHYSNSDTCPLPLFPLPFPGAGRWTNSGPAHVKKLVCEARGTLIFDKS